MKIEIEIPALEGIVPAIKSLAEAIQSKGQSATPTEKPATKKPAGKKAASKVAKEKVEEKPDVTKEELIELGKKLCKLTGGTSKALRVTLDTVIEGEKISTCDPAKYPAVKKALETAIEENDI